MVSITAAISFTAAFVAFFAFGLAAWAVIEVRAMQKSTHQIQFMPADQGNNATDVDINKAFETPPSKEDEVINRFENVL